MAKENMKSCGEQRTGECFGLLPNETIKMKQFLPPTKEDITTCGWNLGYLSDWWSDSKTMRAAFNIWNKSLQKEGEIWKGQGLWFLNVVAEKSKLKSTFRKKYLSARDSWWKVCIGNPFLLWPPWSVRDVHKPWNMPELLSASPFQTQHSTNNSLLSCIKLFWEALRNWWFHVNLSNFGVCFKLVWKTEHMRKEETDGDNIHLIISLRIFMARIFMAQIFMGKLSFQVNSSILHTTKTGLFPKCPKGGATYFTCLPLIPLPNKVLKICLSATHRHVMAEMRT